MNAYQQRYYLKALQQRPHCSVAAQGKDKPHSRGGAGGGAGAGAGADAACGLHNADVVIADYEAIPWERIMKGNVHCDAYFNRFVGLVLLRWAGLKLSLNAAPSHLLQARHQSQGQLGQVLFQTHWEATRFGTCQGLSDICCRVHRRCPARNRRWLWQHVQVS